MSRRTSRTPLTAAGVLTAAALGAGALIASRVKRKDLRPVVDGNRPPRVLFLGGGYVGLYGALELRKEIDREEAEIVLVDPRPYMTYHAFLPEAAAGSLEPRHVVTTLRRELDDATIITGSVTSINHAERTATVQPQGDGEPYELTYDYLVCGLGSVSRTLPIPGLAEFGMGFKHLEDAVTLRNKVLSLLDAAASTWDADKRRRMLTFVFVGGGFAGVEALGEVEDMARAATKMYDSIRPEDLRFVLVEGAGRILPELGEELGAYAVEQLRNRGVEIHLNTFLSSCVDGHIELSTGEEFEAETLVWTTGVVANPVLVNTDLPLDDRDRVTTNAKLQVVDADGNIVAGAFAAGDNAAVPYLAGAVGETCFASAQHAVRQGAMVGRNVAATIRGEQLETYEYENIGTVASLGYGKGVAQVLGVKLRGRPAWFLHRSYHLLAMPTSKRRARIIADWTTALLFRREHTPLGTPPTAEDL